MNIFSEQRFWISTEASPSIDSIIHLYIKKRQGFFLWRFYRLEDNTYGTLSHNLRKIYIVIKKILFILFLVIALPSMANNDKADHNLIILDSLSSIASKASHDQIALYVDTLLSKAKELNSREHISRGIYILFNHYYEQLDIDNFEVFVCRINREFNIKEDEPALYSDALNMLSRMYSMTNNFDLAIQKAMEIYDESEAPADYDLILNEKTGRMELPYKVNNRIVALDCLGWTYYYMDEYEKSLRYMNECVNIIKLYPPEHLSKNLLYSEYGLMMASYGNSDKELQLHNIKQFEDDLIKYGDDNASKTNYLYSIEDEYVDYYCSTNELAKAKYHYDKACNMMDTCAELDYYRDNFYRLGAVYYSAIGNGERAMQFADSATKLYHEENILEVEAEVLAIKINAAHLAKKDSLVYDIAIDLFNLTDTIFDNRYKSAIEHMSATIGRDRLNFDNKRINTEREKMIAFAVMVFLLGGVIVGLLRQRHEREIRNELKNQKKELEEEVRRHTSEITYKHELITSSIRYAQNIQNAMLPDISKIGNGIIEGAFVLHKPCKIVSGDFYWAKQIGDEMLIVLADCEEQGVSGAFFSMIGCTMLNEICSKDITISPNHIISELGVRLSRSLNQPQNKSVDYRMNITSVYIDIRRMTLKFSIARSSVLIYRDEQCMSWENTNDSIGEINSDSVYVTRELSIKKGDIIYIGANGLTTLIGGKDQNQLGIDNVKALLAKAAHMPIYQNEATVKEEIENWIGNQQQHNDISLIGIKI